MTYDPIDPLDPYAPHAPRLGNWTDDEIIQRLDDIKAEIAAIAESGALDDGNNMEVIQECHELDREFDHLIAELQNRH